jgi:sugar/nucleoside kinase (ribokinase family)
MATFDVYLYGMILMTSSYLLRDKYPEPDSYGEIAETHRFPGGETGCCALVLSSLGLSVLADGNYQGGDAYADLLEYFSKTKVDISRLVNDPEFDGVEDLVIIDRDTRTPFGKFEAFFARETKLWNAPEREDIQAASTVGIDPFFGEASESVAKLSKELGKPYVTIDCKFDSLLHRLSAVNIVSAEFIRGNYPDYETEELFTEYTDHSDGLTIFTFGGKNIMYGRRGRSVRSMKPFSVEVKSTLGAGDTFKAGAVYALNKGMSDSELVRFAAATAGVACESYPIAYNPPTLERITKLIESEGTSV